MVTKIVSLVMLAFLKNEAMAYSIAGDFFFIFKVSIQLFTVVTILNRFVSTGFRAFISSLLETDEQGMEMFLISHEILI